MAERDRTGAEFVLDLREDHIQFTAEIAAAQLQPGLTGPLQLNMQSRSE